MLNKAKNIVKDLFTGPAVRIKPGTDKKVTGVELGNDNEIVNSPVFKNSTVNFSGTGNVLYCESTDIVLENSTLTFHGNDSIIYLSKSRRVYRINATVYSDSTIYIGKDNYFNGCLTMTASEQKNIIIGNEGLFSFGCWLRTADPHLVYDADTMSRLNYSKSIMIGDHVWLGQGAMVLKGSRVGSGSIVGAMALVAGKIVPSNCSFGGNPAKLIRDKVFFTGESVHAYRGEQTEASASHDNDEWIYEPQSTGSVSHEELDEKLGPKQKVEDKLDYIDTRLGDTNPKNRFSL